MKKNTILSILLICLIACVEELPMCVVSVSMSGSGSVAINGQTCSSVQITKGSNVTVVASPNKGYEFIGWFTHVNAETPINTDAVYTFAVEESINLVAKFTKSSIDTKIDLAPSGSIDNYDYVDLGLSVKWATFNVGASSIEEIGKYYAWGETTPYNDYTYNNYEWGYFPCSPDRNLASIYDVATTNWSRKWRMPTDKEQKELIEGCDWVWIDNINGTSVSGYVGISRKNGKSIFLPASQYVTHDPYNQPNETDAVYWSSTSTGVPGKVGLQAASTANVIKFNPLKKCPVEWDIWAMGDGATIRPVIGTPNDYFPDPKDLTHDKAETERQGFSVSGKKSGHTYVNLGLPSRTLWGTYNIGADLPTEYGDYFAWGETSPKDYYWDDTYKFFDGYKDDMVGWTQYTKYVYDKKHGQVDGKYILEYTDDAAYANWGEDWCMPTQEQWNELNAYCKIWRKDIVVNGKKIIGCIVESWINGNRLYFPYAGWEYSDVPNSHMSGWYWTSELCKKGNTAAMIAIFIEDEYRIDCEQSTHRFSGLPVRGVVNK